MPAGLLGIEELDRAEIAAILARAKSYGENRLLCGVHYRSDIIAGQVLGSVVAEELLANPTFKSDFEAAKAELAAARAH